MTRLWMIGEPITVEVDAEGMPVAFTWQGRRHVVVQIAKRWRADVGWWRGGMWHLWREHHKMVTQSGLLVVIYRDLLSGQWFFQRLYD